MREWNIRKVERSTTMINITDTKYQEKELKDLLENAGKTLDTAGVIAVKNAYVKGIDREHWKT